MMTGADLVPAIERMGAAAAAVGQAAWMIQPWEPPPWPPDATTYPGANWYMGGGPYHSNTALTSAVEPWSEAAAVDTVQSLATIFAHCEGAWARLYEAFTLFDDALTDGLPGLEGPVTQGRAGCVELCNEISFLWWASSTRARGLKRASARA